MGLAGVPGSGKSTLAKLIIQNVDAVINLTSCTAEDAVTEAVAVSLDGWHLTRAQLDKFEDPALAHGRFLDDPSCSANV